MRHRLLALAGLLMLGIAAIASGIDPIANAGGILVLVVVTVLGIAVLFGALLALRGLLFDRGVSRYRRFN